MAYIGNRPVSGDNNSFRVLDDIKTHTFSFDGSSSSVVSTSNNTITHKGHRLVQGQRVTYTDGTGSAIGGLTDGTVYFVVINDANSFKLASSASNAAAGTGINLTSVGSGTAHTITVAFDGVNTKFKATFNNGTEADVTRVAQIQISLNNVIQQPQNTATPTSGFGFDTDSVIVFATAPASNATFWGVLFANNFPTFEISDNDVDSFTGDGSATEFSLSKSPATNENIIVTIDGVVQYPSDNSTTRAYNTVGNALQFSSAPANGSDIQARHIGFAGPDPSVAGVTAFYGRTGSVFLNNSDNIVVNNAEVAGNLTVQGDTTTLNTTLRNVELLRVDGNDTVAAGIITQRGSGDILKLYDTSTPVFVVKDGGKVGIGTDNPNAELDIEGEFARIHLHDYDGNQAQIIQSGNSLFLNLDSEGNGGGSLRIRSGGMTSDSEIIRIKADGTVGIGSTAPTEKLDVIGNIKSSGTITGSSFVGALPITNDGDNRIITASGSGGLNAEGGLLYDGTYFTHTGSGYKQLTASTTTNNSVQFKLQNQVKNFTITNVAGGVFQIAEGSISRFKLQDGVSFLDSTVGVGTNSLTNLGNSQVNIEGTAALTNHNQTLIIRDSVADDATGRGGNIGFGAYVDGTMRTLAAIGAFKKNSGTGFDGHLALYTRRNGVGPVDEVMRLESGGDVGIGTDNPLARLDVYKGESATDVDIFAVRSKTGAFNIQCSDTDAANPEWRLRTYVNEDIVFSPGGTGSSGEKLRITSSGEVRIANGGLLTIKTDAVATYGVSEALRIDDNNVTNDRAFQIFEYQNAGGRWFSLNQNLDVTTTGSSYTYTQGNYGGSNMIQMDSGDLRIYSDPSIVSGGTSAITPTERIRLRSDGKVLIGNTLGADPYDDRKFTVNSTSNNYISIQSGDSSFSGIVFGHDSGQSTDNFLTYVRHNNVDNKFAIHTNSGSTPKVVITSAGDVGIGSESPQTKLDVNGSITANDVVTAGALLHEDDTDTLVHFSAANTIELKTGGFSRLSVNNFGVALQTNATFNVNGGRIILGDSTVSTTDDRIVLGNSDDCFLYHDSTDTFIENNTGILKILGNTIQLGDGTDKVGINSTSPTHELEVLGDSSLKGNLTVSGLSTFSERVTCKNLLASSDGNTSISILDTGHGFNATTLGLSNGGRDFAITAPRDIRLRPSGGLNGIVIENNGPVGLYHANALRLTTSSAGVSIPQDLDVDGHTNLDNVSIVGVATVTGSNINIEGGSAALTQLKINSTGRYRGVQLDENGTRKAHFQHDATDNKTVVGTAEGTMQFNSGDTPRIILNSSGHWVPYVDSTYDLGISATRWRNLFVDDIDANGNLDVSGNVGVGSAPDEKLHVVISSATATAAKFERSHNNNVSIEYRNTTSRMFAGLAGDALGWAVDNDANLGVGPMFMVRRTTGYVGVSVVEPLRQLDVVGNSLLVRPTIDNISSSGNASAVNNSIIIRMPYGENPGSTNHGGARFGIQFTAANNTTDVSSLNWGDDPVKSASIYGVSEDNLGYNRKVGLAFYTSEFDAVQEERLRIKNDGKVGIGTNDPDEALHIQSASPVIKFSDGTLNSFIKGDGSDLKFISGGTSKDFMFQSSILSTSEVVRITGDGNVGIGTNNPFTSGAHSGTHQLTVADNAPSMSLGLSNNDQLYIRRELANGKFTFQSVQSGGNNGVIALQPYGGNVGIGTITPERKLDVIGDVGIEGELFLGEQTAGAIGKITAPSGNVDIYADGTIDFIESDNNKTMVTFDINTVHDDARIYLEGDLDTYFNHPDSNQLGFTIGGTDTMRLRAGKVGIGTHTPDSPLHVETPANQSVVATFGATGDTAETYQALTIRNNMTGYPALANVSSTDVLELRSAGSVQATIDANNNDTGKFFRVSVNGNADTATELFRVQENGNVGINSSSPSATLEIKDIGSTGPCILIRGATSTEGDITVPDGETFNFGHWNYSSSTFTERVRVSTDGVITAQKSASFGNTSDSFTAVQITASTTGISELRFGDTTANAGYVKYEHNGNNLIFATDADERVNISSAGLTTLKNFNGTGLKLEGSGSDYQGMQLQVTDASASQTRNIFIDTVNETGAAVANQVGQVQSDGGSHWSWSTQAAGDRTDRRVERVRITPDGELGINTNTNNTSVLSFRNSVKDHKIGGVTVVLANDTISGDITLPGERHGCLLTIFAHSDANGTYPQPGPVGFVYVDVGASTNIRPMFTQGGTGADATTTVGTSMVGKNSHETDISNCDDGKLTIMKGSDDGKMKLANRLDSTYHFYLTMM